MTLANEGHTRVSSPPCESYYYVFFFFFFDIFTFLRFSTPKTSDTHFRQIMRKVERDVGGSVFSAKNVNKSEEISMSVSSRCGNIPTVALVRIIFNNNNFKKRESTFAAERL